MKKLLLLLILLASISVVFANDCAYIVYFYQTGCHACASAEPVLDSIEENYNVVIDRRELHEEGNYYLFLEYLELYNVPEERRGYTPTTFVNDEFIVGFSGEFEDTVTNIISNCPPEGCLCNFNQTLAEQYNASLFPQVSPSNGYYLGVQDSISNVVDLTIPTIVSAALIDSINPCAFAVMIFLLTYLMREKNKKQILIIGGFYVFTVFLTYLLAGMGLFLTIQTTEMTIYVYYGAAILAILAGIVNVKDFFWYGKGFTLRIDKKYKSTISKWGKQGTIISAIILGFLVSMFELPCTGGVYLAILGLLSSTSTISQAILPLILYNFIFVLPLIVLMLLVYFGVASSKLEKWRKQKRNYMKLVSGIFMMGLGIYMLVQGL